MDKGPERWTVADSAIRDIPREEQRYYEPACLDRYLYRRLTPRHTQLQRAIVAVSEHDKPGGGGCGATTTQAFLLLETLTTRSPCHHCFILPVLSLT